MGLISAKYYVGPQRLKGKPFLAAKQITHSQNRGSGACQFLSGRLSDGRLKKKGRRSAQKLHTRRHGKRVPKTLDLGSGCFP
jgi:hypothetical protein